MKHQALIRMLEVIGTIIGAVLVLAALASAWFFMFIYWHYFR